MSEDKSTVEEHTGEIIEDEDEFLEDDDDTLLDEEDATLDDDTETLDDDEDIDGETLTDEHSDSDSEFEDESSNGIMSDGTIDRGFLKKYIESDDDEESAEEIIYDNSGNPVKRQIEGEVYVKVLDISDIILTPSCRNDIESDIHELEESISDWGLLEPIHVVPFNGKYLILNGRLRYKALLNMRIRQVLCLVDTTRPKESIRFAEVIANGVKAYNFSEIITFGIYVQQKQNTFSFRSIEKLLRLPYGDYYKALYIKTSDNMDIIGGILGGKFSINQGYKKLLKEEEKRDKELSPLDELNQMNSDDLTTPFMQEGHLQTTGNREILPEWLATQVVTRDLHTCQCCGAGHGQPELVGIFEKHHVIPVRDGGRDELVGLILLCKNCHSLVHNYEQGKFVIPKGKEAEYHNIIVLGNIIKKGVKDGEKPYDMYIKNYDPFWLAG